jgi:hypothetical protein
MSWGALPTSTIVELVKGPQSTTHRIFSLMLDIV